MVSTRHSLGWTGAVGLILLGVTPAFSQTAINVPQAATDYADVADPDDACNKSFAGYLNEPACEAAREAQTLEEETIPDAQDSLTAAQEELAAAQEADAEELASLNAELAAADELLAEAEAALAAAQADSAAAVAAAEAAAGAVNSAQRSVLLAAAREGLALDDYIAANPDDAAVTAYLSAVDAYEAALEDAATKVAAITDATDARDEQLSARNDAQTAVADFEPSASADLVDAVADAQAALTSAQADLATAQAAASTPLPAGENRNFDIVTGDAANPAKAVLEASICAAAGASIEGCDDESAADVGQAIVNGFDDLYQTDQELDGRLTAAEGDIDTLQAGLATETAERKAADTVLQANIDKETTDRKAADTVLQANIDKEVTDRKAADTALQTSIANETAARTAADLVLDNKIKGLDTRVTQIGARVDALTKESRQGIAMAMALSSIPTVNYGKFSLGVGIGTFASETAAALGADFVVSERVKFKVGFTTTGDESGGSAGFAIGF